VRETKDFSGVWREGTWLLGCVGAALALSHFVEDKGDQTAFVSAVLYVLSGGIRLGARALRNRL
jgi:hypothetical protein